MTPENRNKLRTRVGARNIEPIEVVTASKPKEMP